MKLRRMKTLGRLALVSLIWLGLNYPNFAQEEVSRQPPYPNSRLVKDVQWAPVETVIRKAKGGDNWPITWARDGALYSTYGDGWGFEPLLEDKLSLGLVRIDGGPEDFKVVNLRSATIEQRGQGRHGRKSWGILSVDGVLYLWLGHDNLHGGESTLAWSEDHGETWSTVDWKFAEFGLLGFINFGRDYEGARDEFVYAYSHDAPNADGPADRFILMRAHKDHLLERDAWEFFVRTDANQQPVWSKRIEERGAVFEHPDACLRSAITFNPGLNRYLWWQAIPQPPGHPDRGDTRFEGGFGIYDAPEPWGPWTTVEFVTDWDIGPGEHGDFPTKWMSEDGRTVHLVFSGDDCFCVREAVFVTE